MFSAGLILALVQTSVRAEDKAQFKDEKEKASYAIGMYFGNQIKRGNLDLDADVVAGAMKDILAGKEARITDQEGMQVIRSYQMESKRKLAEKNEAEGAKFLAENKKKDGVKTQTVTLPDGKTAEWQYKVITEGTGEIPKSNDVVSVTYRGTLIDGKEFDSSAKHGGAPLKRAANQLIRGWTEALQMMKVGSKWELYLPPALAYGEHGTPTIEPGSTLVFEVELLGVEAPKPPPVAGMAHPQPLTSDIIKVPSAEELKKGAKIEVIKPEDVAKQAAQGDSKTKQ